jgi:hypothetical protein
MAAGARTEKALWTTVVFASGLATARAPSLAATLGTFAGVFARVRREAGDTPAAAVAVGPVAASYGVTGFWFDLVRPEVLLIPMEPSAAAAGKAAAKLELP